MQFVKDNYLKLLKKHQDEFQKMNVNNQQLLFGGLGGVIEWTGETPAVEVYQFDWPKFAVCDMREAKLLRVEIRGTWRAVIAFSEEKEHWSKKITFTFMGVNGDWNGPAYVAQNQEFQFNSKTLGFDTAKYDYRGKLLNGHENPVWFEIDWNL